MNNRKVGETGEQIAVDYLIKNGFTILKGISDQAGSEK